MKFLLYQILATFVVWLGMFFFLDELYDAGRIIFYIVTSWLLFLVVLLIRTLVQKRRL